MVSMRGQVDELIVHVAEKQTGMEERCANRVAESQPANPEKYGGQWNAGAEPNDAVLEIMRLAMMPQVGFVLQRRYPRDVRV